jgi:hypothetical protein
MTDRNNPGEGSSGRGEGTGKGTEEGPADAQRITPTGTLPTNLPAPAVERNRPGEVSGRGQGAKPKAPYGRGTGSGRRPAVSVPLPPGKWARLDLSGKLTGSALLAGAGATLPTTQQPQQTEESATRLPGSSPLKKKLKPTEEQPDEPKKPKAEVSFAIVLRLPPTACGCAPTRHPQGTHLDTFFFNQTHRGDRVVRLSGPNWAGRSNVGTWSGAPGALR